MANLSGAVQQLKKELERAQREVRQFGAALAALGKHTNRRPDLSPEARHRISLAQKARWAKHKAAVQTWKLKRTMSRQPQEYRGSSTGEMGESQESKESRLTGRDNFRMQLGSSLHVRRWR
ncbi:MAG TPA: hypothetical protein VI386_01940 [Candidatus Sulfotelmatobacter sp.]